MSVGTLVSNVAVLGAIGAGIAALAISLTPSMRRKAQDKKDKKETPKEKDPTMFIDSGAGNPDRYRLAFNDLMHGRVYLISLKKNLGVKDGDGGAPISAGGDAQAAKTAMELARTTFDAGIVQAVPGKTIELTSGGRQSRGGEGKGDSERTRT